MRPLIVLAALCALPLFAQDEAPIQVDVNVVNVPVTVTDDEGRFIVDLQKDDFEIYESGKLQKRFVRDKLSSYGRHQTRVDFGRAMALFEHIVGGETDARHLDQRSIDNFVDTRRAGLYLTLKDGGRRKYASADARFDLELLDQVFKYCMRLKLDESTWLLPSHPFERLDLSVRSNGKVSIYRDVWYTEMLKVADEVDPHGRFRLMLAMAWASYS